MVRVTKREAPVLVSVIGRLRLLGSSMLAKPKEGESDPKLCRRIERTGDSDGHLGFAHCHFFLVEELEEDLRRAGLTIVRTARLEGLLPPYPQQVDELAKRYASAFRSWEERHMRTCENAAFIPFSQRVMVVGRKACPRGSRRH